MKTTALLFCVGFLSAGCGTLTIGPAKPSASKAESDADEDRKHAAVRNDRKVKAMADLEGWEKSNPPDGSGEWADKYRGHWAQAWHEHMGVEGNWAGPLRARLADLAADNVDKALAKKDPVAARLTIGAASNELYGEMPTEKFTSAAARVAEAYLGRDRERFASTHTYAQEGNEPGCVFSTQAFGPEGTANAGLTRTLHGKGKAYARCYTPIPVRSIAGDELVFTAAAYRNKGSLQPTSLGVPAQQAAERRKFIDITFDLGNIPRSTGEDPERLVALATVDVKKQEGMHRNDRGDLEPLWVTKGITGAFFLWESN